MIPCGDRTGVEGWGGRAGVSIPTSVSSARISPTILRQTHKRVNLGRPSRVGPF